MRSLAISGLIGIIIAVSSVRLLEAQAATVSKWQDVRDHQPTGLNLKLTLSKDHFFQGERIEATLDFTNDETAFPYHLGVGARGGGVGFHAFDEKGNVVVNPLQWRNDWYPITSTGIFGEGYEVGRCSVKLRVNDSLRFDQPGTYTLYAQSNLWRRTAANKDTNVSLVSDQKTITIVPRTAAQEMATLADARQAIGSSDSPDDRHVQEGIEELSCLQTPAAHDELIALLARPKLVEFVREGLLAAPDTTEIADKLMALVKPGKLVPDEEMAGLYGSLKTADLIRGTSPSNFPPQESERRFQEMWSALYAARRELVAASVAATGDHGANHIEALWTAFLEIASHNNPWREEPDGGKARRALAEHQLELPSKHVKELLDCWDNNGSADFLPLVRREAGPPHNNLIALIALAGLRPDEARPKIIEEFQQPDPRFFERNYPSSTMLCVIPPMPLPQFDSLFRAKLNEEKGDAFPIISVIGCFGSPALLPDVVKAYRQYGQDIVNGSSRTEPWDSAIKQCLFRYWLRSDPKGGATALEQAITARGPDGAGPLMSVLQYPWMEEGLPVVKWALDQSDPGLVGEGVYFTEQHADVSSIDSVISSLKRMQGNALNSDFSSREAAYLLKSTRWSYSSTQRKELEALASAPSQK